MIRLLRSRLLWLGLPGLLFLGWAWADSMKHGHGVGWGSKGFGIFLSHGAGSLRLGIDDASQRDQGFDFWTWGVEEDAVPAGDSLEPRVPWFPPPKWLFHEGDSGLTRVTVPYWLFAVLYGAAWGAIGYRQHRFRRRHFRKESEPPSPQEAEAAE